MFRAFAPTPHAEVEHHRPMRPPVLPQISQMVAAIPIVHLYADRRFIRLQVTSLDGWVMRVGEFLVPLAEALRQELLRGSYLQADETPVGVQMHDGNGSNHLAYLWQ